ncbi:GNAT family N-acetyltransferase [Bacillus infantis]|jgi:[ribosomal protein S5]-alanine N-acetyltransferase|uniref:GNAT family N-acetyltransferase n=1 Tax=Bacillus infantis TaxID=324767 RepID=UPI002155EC70|nr:GNAT family protein [Bacillus infantis]MCR6612626.1 GNAT family N-acetyltransferase [Bacillus infantis]
MNNIKEKLKGSFPEIETDRLLLRKVKLEDAADILRYLSDPEVTKYYGLEPFADLEDARSEIGWYERILKEGTGVRWGISLKGGKELIGSCGFLNMDSGHFRADIGLELNPAYWNQGIGTEAIEAIIRYGFDNLNLMRIQALIEPANLQSQRLFGKCGFIREGLLRNYEYTCGKFDDLLMFSIINPDHLGPGS